MKLQVLGTGCKKCLTLGENTAAAARELGIDAEIEKVTDIVEIMKFGVMVTPALAVDGKVVVKGKVPAVAELKKIINQEMENGK